MDDMERLLARLRNEPVPADLAARVTGRFHRRYQRRQTIQLVASTLMMLAGAWLFIPWLMSVGGQISLPQNGLPLLQSIFSFSDPGFAVDTTVRSVSNLQTSMSSSIAMVHWLGFVALSMGALGGISSLLPGYRPR